LRGHQRGPRHTRRQDYVDERKIAFHRIRIAGLVYGSGQVRMNGVAGPRDASGTGRFMRTKGNGKWNGTEPSGVCSGYWVAVRG
jgi:hypothetical protein